MIPNLPPGTTWAVHLRSPSVSGGKDWVGAVTSNAEFHVFWGKTGNINQKSVKRGIRHDLDEVSLKKQAKGYTVVDEYHSNSGWTSQRSQQTTQPKPATPPQPSTPTGPPVNLLKQVAPTDPAVPSAAVTPLAWDF